MRVHAVMGHVILCIAAWPVPVRQKGWHMASEMASRCPVAPFVAAFSVNRRGSVREGIVDSRGSRVVDASGEPGKKSKAPEGGGEARARRLPFGRFAPLPRPEPGAERAPRARQEEWNRSLPGVCSCRPPRVRSRRSRPAALAGASSLA